MEIAYFHKNFNVTMCDVTIKVMEILNYSLNIILFRHVQYLISPLNVYFDFKGQIYVSRSNRKWICFTKF